MVIIAFAGFYFTAPAFAKAVNQHDQVELDRSEYLTNYYNIPIQAGKEILTTDNNKLKRNLVIAGLVSTTFLLDQGIRDFAQANFYAGDTVLSELLYNLGTVEYIVPGYILAGSYSYLTEDMYLQDSLLLSFQSLIVTQMFTGATKSIVGRGRPRISPQDPFKRTGGRSFFSGHASGSWSVMTVLAHRYPKYRWPAYGLAAAVAASRIYEDAHWLSDVVTGSLVGYGIAKLTLELNQNQTSQLTFQPWLEPQGSGILVSMDF